MSFKILVTGGNGFIGSHLCPALAKLGHDVTSFSRSEEFAYEDAASKKLRAPAVRVVKGDVREREAFESLIKESEIVFHQAAIVGVEDSVSSKDSIDINVHGTTNLVEILKSTNHSVQKVILSSSLSVYGEGCYHCAGCGKVRPAIRMSENELLGSRQWNPLCPICGGTLSPTITPETAERMGESQYASSKKEQEDLLISACKQLGISLFILRYASVFGPGMSTNNPYSKFIDMMLAGYSPQIYEDGMQTRDFIFIEDAINIKLSTIETALTGINTYNVGSGKQTPLLEIVQCLSDCVASWSGAQLVVPVVTRRLRAGDIRHCQVRCDLAEKELHFRAAADLQTSIQSLIEHKLHLRHA